MPAVFLGAENEVCEKDGDGCRGESDDQIGEEEKAECVVCSMSK